jgi:DHA2 family multidrug resistance protein
LAGSIGISMVTTMASRGAQTHQAALVAHASPYDIAFQKAVQSSEILLAGHVGTAQAHSGALTLIHQQLLQQSALLAYLDDFRWLGVVCLIAVPLVLLLKRVVLKSGGAMMAH